MRFSTSLLALSLPLCLLAAEETCKTTEQPYRVTLRNIEGNGVGYNTGYTTLELFSSIPSQVPTSFIPFLDLRFHVLNDGKPACNAGFGMRFLSSSWAWGVNTYYDYRKTSWQHYNQVALGFEALGKVWDFRLNGYLPVGAKESSLHGAKFSRFSGNRIILGQKREFAMRGLSGEAGIHIKKMKHAAFYGAFGPYYFAGLNKNAIGGEARLNGTFFEHIKAEISSSYDNIFHGIFQGELSLIFPMGPKKTLKNRPDRACSREARLRERALQPVDRNEIVVVDKKREHHAATNPNSGLPYNVIFVDNTSHSHGTYESPYPTLAQAESASKPYDVIYVFPGDGSTTGYDTGFIMQDYQHLLGSGVAHGIETKQGVVFIPQMTQGLPNLTLATDPEVKRGIVNMGNHCRVSGLRFTTTTSFGQNLQAAIAAPVVARPVISYNIVQGPFGEGIAVRDSSESCFVVGNTVSGTQDVGIGVGTAGAVDLVATVSDNTVSNTGGNAIVLVTDAGNLSAKVINNIVSNSTGIGIYLKTTGNGALTATVSGNQVSGTGNNGGPGSYGIGLQTGDGALTATVAGNQVSNSGSMGIALVATGAGAVTATASSNQVSNSGYLGLYLVTGDGDLNASVSSNQVSNSGGGGINLATGDGPLNAAVAGNQVSNSQGVGINLNTGTSALSATVSGNQVIKAVYGIQISTEQTACATISNNTILESSDNCIQGLQQSTTPSDFANLLIFNNMLQGADSGGDGLISLTSSGGSLCAAIENNHVSNSSGVMASGNNSTIQIFSSGNEGNTEQIIGTYTPLSSNTCGCE